MENRIKEQFSLFADRVSAETMRANQMRLYLSTMAYILASALRRLGLKGTELAEAQVSTIRTRLLKIGGQIRVTVGKVWNERKRLFRHFRRPPAADSVQQSPPRSDGWPKPMEKSALRGVLTHDRRRVRYAG